MSNIKGDMMKSFKEIREIINHDICSKMGYYHKINKKEIQYCLDMTNETIIYSYKEIPFTKIDLK